MSAAINRSSHRMLEPLPERLSLYYNSTSRLHAGPDLLAWLKQFRTIEEEHQIDYWQTQCDNILQSWVLGRLSSYEAMQLYAILKQQAFEAITVDSTSRQSITAMLNAGWELLYTTYTEQECQARNQLPSSGLKLFHAPSD